mmetsp:Transcript_14554/g.25878  ORF Transcript_14554/g.25878 Transcript_14554/m.25878 type:complete len:321 (+) Transcript_14554:3494-4456(+)
MQLRSVLRRPRPVQLEHGQLQLLRRDPSRVLGRAHVRPVPAGLPRTPVYRDVPWGCLRPLHVAGYLPRRPDGQRHVHLCLQRHRRILGRRRLRPVLPWTLGARLPRGVPLQRRRVRHLQRQGDLQRGAPRGWQVRVLLQLHRWVVGGRAVRGLRARGLRGLMPRAVPRGGHQPLLRPRHLPLGHAGRRQLHVPRRLPGQVLRERLPHVQRPALRWPDPRQVLPRREARGRLPVRGCHWRRHRVHWGRLRLGVPGEERRAVRRARHVRLPPRHPRLQGLQLRGRLGWRGLQLLPRRLLRGQLRQDVPRGAVCGRHVERLQR